MEQYQTLKNRPSIYLTPNYTDFVDVELNQVARKYAASGSVKLLEWMKLCGFVNSELYGVREGFFYCTDQKAFSEIFRMMTCHHIIGIPASNEPTFPRKNRVCFSNSFMILKPTQTSSLPFKQHNKFFYCSAIDAKNAYALSLVLERNVHGLSNTLIGNFIFYAAFKKATWAVKVLFDTLVRSHVEMEKGFDVLNLLDSYWEYGYLLLANRHLDEFETYYTNESELRQIIESTGYDPDFMHAEWPRDTRNLFMDGIVEKKDVNMLNWMMTIDKKFLQPTAFHEMLFETYNERYAGNNSPYEDGNPVHKWMAEFPSTYGTALRTLSSFCKETVDSLKIEYENSPFNKHTLVDCSTLKLETVKPGVITVKSVEKITSSPEESFETELVFVAQFDFEGKKHIKTFGLQSQIPEEVKSTESLTFTLVNHVTPFEWNTLINFNPASVVDNFDNLIELYK